MRSARPLLLALLLLVAPAAAQSDALGVSPSSIDVPDAVPGGSYQAVVTVQNGFDAPARFTLAPDGEVGGWTVTEPAGAVEVPARGRATVAVLVDVPSDVALGEHTGVLRVVAQTTNSSGTSGSGAALRYAVGIAMSVNVTGVPREAVAWRGATAPKIEVGNPAVVLVHVENTGNVRTRVSAVAEALDAAGAAVVANGSAAEDLLPGLAQVLAVDLGPLPEGNHPVRVRAEGVGGPYETRTVVQVLPAGALARSGRIAGLDVPAEVDVGAPLRIEARFENTGQSPIARASLVYEVYRDGRLVGQGSGEGRIVAPGTVAPLVAYYTPTSAGELRVVVKVAFDGLETATNEAKSTAIGAAGEAPPKETPAAAWGATALALAAAAWRRRR